TGLNLNGGTIQDAAGSALSGPVQGDLAQQVVLSFSSAVATFSQNFGFGYDPSQMFDGNFTRLNGWAIFRDDGTANETHSETALLTLSSPLPAGHYSLTFNLYQFNNPGSSLGDFSLGYATDNSPTLSSTETPFAITDAKSLNGTTFTFPTLGQILATGPVPSDEVYTITVDVNSAAPI